MREQEESILAMLKPKWIVVGALTFILLLWIGCGVTKISAGFVGIKVHLIGGEKGVMDKVGVGYHMVWFNQELYKIPISIQNKVWTHDKVEDSPINEEFSLQTKDGMVSKADIGIQFLIQEDKVVHFFEKYRSTIMSDSGDVVHSVKTILKARIRDAFNSECSKIESADLYGEKRMEVIDNALKIVQASVKEDGILIDKLFWINDIRLPSQIVEMLNNKVKAVQEGLTAQNQLVRATAEAKIKVVEAQADAEKNRLSAQQLTPLIIQKLWIERWDGHSFPQAMSDHFMLMPKFGER